MLARLRERQTAWDTFGTGRPVVLLHPFPSDGRSWRPVATRVTGATLILPDLRGFGRSELGEGAFSVADLADDIAALLDHLGHDRVVLGGLSMGGYVALAFAQRYPDRLAGLFLADTKAAPDTPEARRARDEAMALVRDQGVDAYVVKQLPKLLAATAGEPVRAEVRALGQQPAATVLAALAALRDRPDRRPELPSIRCPTLVLVGTEDAVTPPSEARAMADAIPGALLVEVAGAGHLSHLEAPDDVADALTRFLAAL